jgi:glycosyltransferase 2 family protein
LPRPGWGALARAGVTVSVLAWLALQLDWAKFLQQLAAADPGSLLLAGALLALALAVSSIRWWFLLRVQGVHLPVVLVTRITFVGLFFNLFMLGATGGDVIKAFYAAYFAPEGKRACSVLTIIIDRALGMLVLAGVVIVALPWYYDLLMQRGELRVVAYFVAAVLAVSATAGVLLLLSSLYHLPEWAVRAWRKVPHSGKVDWLPDAVRSHVHAWRSTLGAIAAGGVVVALTVAAGCWIADAIRLPISYDEMALVIAFVACITSLPISIAGHGVREGAFVLMFGALGIISSADPAAPGGPELGVLFSLLFFALHAAWGAVGGLLFLGLKRPGFGELSASAVRPQHR